SREEIKKMLHKLNVREDILDKEALSQTLRILINIVESLSDQNEKLKIEIQKLRDENNRLKGEQGKPNIRGNKGGGKGQNFSSEKERKERKEKKKKKSKSKKENIQIDRSEVCEVDPSKLPADAEFKGYESLVVQEIIIKTDNVEYKKEVFYSASEKRTYVGELPAGIVGEFGSGIRSLVCTLKYVANMSQPKIHELLENCGVFISQPTISRILTDDETGFNQEKKDIFRAALEHTPYHQIDDTTVRVNGKNQYSQILCNPYYTAFFTVPRKDRLTILDLLLCGRERTYRFDLKAFCLMSDFKVAKKVTDQLLNLTEDKEISETEMQLLLEKVFKKGKGKNTKARIMEAAAIAAYHSQTDVPVVDILLADDAPQFKKLVEELALCWIHEGRHYNRLDPIVLCNVDALKDFKTRFWDFYGDLLKFKQTPSPETAEKLSIEFDELFTSETIYAALNDRIEKTKNKKDELLLVLKYPWLPLHNNDAELGARVEKRRQDVSLHTISKAGTTAKDAFLTIVQTAKKLGINAFEYINDRVSKKFSMPALSDLIIERAKLQPG
ncbi:MAG: transposase, partial [Desulfobacterales bacterium]|nr:transposase [Desulfobacterales bacterium]